MQVWANVDEWRGKDVYLKDGEKLGKLEEVYYDAETDESLFLSVKAGRFSNKHLLVSLRGVAVSPDHLAMAWSKDDLDGAPTTKPGEGLDPDGEERAFRHYGMDYQRPSTSSGRRLVRR